MDADHLNLLFHTQVRWLSRGNTLLRVFELREELREFLRLQKKDEWVKLLESGDWLSKLCYLTDIFERLLNRSLQGKDSDLIVFHDKMNGFLAALKLLKGKVLRQRFSLLPPLCAYLEESDNVDKDDLCTNISEHIESLIDQFDLYFPELDSASFSVIRDPFTAAVDMMTDDDAAQEELVLLQEDTGAKAMFRTTTLSTFWCNLLPSIPRLSEKAIKLLMPYPPSYLCEQSFSTMVVLKTKYRNRLDIENDMIVSLGCTEPRISKLVTEKQSQPSH